jgi:long-chain acyl-CoA synthetase
VNDRPWLAHYDPGVPYTLEPYPKRTLLDYLSDAAQERPHSPFLLFKRRCLSWGEVEQLSDRFAVALVKDGVQRGDRVALILVNCPQAVIAQLGVWKAGAIAVPLNPLYTERELEHALVNVDATVAVVLTLCYSRVKAVQPRTSLRRIIASNIKDFLPRHLALLFTVTKEKKDGHRVTLAEGDVWFTTLLGHAAPERPALAVEPGNTALLLFTGGTTGTPKAAVFLTSNC